jgi:phosphate:Na+ symporter
VALFQSLAVLLGGLGLFMLAVGIISDGLRLVAGRALRNILGQWTHTPFRGLISGVAITGLVQSSSAVTVATIGFVNSGLMTLKQSLGVVFGANVGTTMTGWLVALIGFKLKIELFALPLIGLGMFLHLLCAGKRIAHLGWALVGFGLFFVGIDVLRTAFDGLSAGIDFHQLSSNSAGGAVAFVGIGFMMTVLTQSSSAAIAIILTGAAGQLVGLSDAALMVIGANLGTTSTAVIAVVGATANAKRVAAAHVLFNLLSAVAAVIILPLLMWLIAHISGLLNLANTPEVVLALFHTVFNLLGVVLIWPLMSRLSGFLSQRFVSKHEIASKPIYIDKNVAVSPAIAVVALYKELLRISDLSHALLSASVKLENKSPANVVEQYHVIEQLGAHTAEFVTSIEKQQLTEELAGGIKTLILAQQYCLSSAEHALSASAAVDDIVKDIHPNPLSDLQKFIRTSRRVLSSVSSLDEEGYDEAYFLNKLAESKLAYEEMKTMVLRYTMSSMLTVQASMASMDLIKTIQQMCEQYIKARAQLHSMHLYLGS